MPEGLFGSDETGIRGVSSSAERRDAAPWLACVACRLAISALMGADRPKPTSAKASTETGSLHPNQTNQVPVPRLSASRAIGPITWLATVSGRIIGPAHPRKKVVNLSTADRNAFEARPVSPKALTTPMPSVNSTTEELTSASTRPYSSIFSIPPRIIRMYSSAKTASGASMADASRQSTTNR